MNKTELVNSIAEKSGLSKKNSEAALNGNRLWTARCSIAHGARKRVEGVNHS